jgi:sugar lactone lactonase YvrE
MIHTRLLAALLVVALVCAATTAFAGTLYVNEGPNSTIVAFDTTATNPTPTIFASTGPHNPGGLAIDASGNVYVGYPDNDTIEKFTPKGWTWASLPRHSAPAT